jgi:uncharacterized membrane-anchored protein YhcB (DUF1043 family)
VFSYWSVLILIVIGVLIYRYNRQVIAAARQFDRRNIERIQQEMDDRRDALAHYRRTAEVAEEQVEEVMEIAAMDERLGTPVTRYVFEAEVFATRDEAEAARQRSIIAKAREYYKELPAALAGRGKDRLN